MLALPSFVLAVAPLTAGAMPAAKGAPDAARGATPTVSAQAPAPDRMSVSVLAGGAKVMQGDFGPLVRAEVVVPLLRTPSGLPIALVVPLSTSYSGSEERDVEVDAVVFELAPGVRTGLTFGGRLSLYADAGLGLVHARVRSRTDQQFVGKVSEVDGKTTALFRFALGLSFAASDRFTVGVEPLGLGYDLEGAATWTLLLGAAYCM